MLMIFKEEDSKYTLNIVYLLLPLVRFDQL